MCWDHLFNFKNMKNTHGVVLLLVKLEPKSLTLIKVTLLHGCFSRFLNCTYDTKSCNASHTKLTTIYALLRNVNTQTTKRFSGL